jgi:uncharacterized protein YbjT (DUF2867 family)
MILVTGATGHAGRALVHELISKGVPVRAMVRDRAKAMDLAAAGAEIVVADLGQPETLRPAIAGIQRAYLMTAPDPEQVRMNSNFIRAARQEGITYIARVSVHGADPESPVKIRRWHAASQKELEDSGIAWTHLQPVYNMQNFLRLAATIRSQSTLVAPMKSAALSMVDARDIAAVAAVALSDSAHEGKTYVITGPEPLTFADAAAHLSEALGKPVRYVDIAGESFRQAMLQMNMPEWYVDDLVGFYGFYSTGAGAAVRDVVPRITGQRGRSFRQFVHDYRSSFTGTR